MPFSPRARVKSRSTAAGALRSLKHSWFAHRTNWSRRFTSHVASNMRNPWPCSFPVTSVATRRSPRKIIRLPGPADMNNQSVRDLGTSQTAAVRDVDPSAAGVDHSPDEESFARVPPDADQRAIEGCRRTEPANLVLAQFSFVD